MLKPHSLYVDDSRWTPAYEGILKMAASNPQVERVLVHPGVKKKLCDTVKGDRSWLSKIRPWYGHDYHFHIRMRCPAGDKECKGQPDQSSGEACQPSDLAYWFKDSIIHPPPPTEPTKPAHGITLAQLPSDCRKVLSAPDAKPSR